MARLFRFSQKTPLYKLKEVGFTHIEGRCLGCRRIRRKKLAAFSPVVFLTPIGEVRTRLTCSDCAGKMDHRTVRLTIEEVHATPACYLWPM